MERRWMLKQTSTDIMAVAREAEVNPIIATLLVHRDIKRPEEIKRFLRTSLQDLYDGKLMKDMKKGVAIIRDSIKMGKKIYIYGDYDVDGVISTYILYKVLAKCGANVSYHIPDRESEGYGMNEDRIRLLSEEGCEVILTCDNGIAAYEQIKLAKELGMQVIVTDHHDVPFVDEAGVKRYLVPEADAVINPKQEDCPYPFKLLCGGVIAYKFTEVLYEAMGIKRGEAKELLQYAAIATICDVVDLVDENRIIAKKGLEMLNNTDNLGLRALMVECGLDNKTITAYHLGFVIGPCINATGRLESAKLSVELLLCEDEDEAVYLAKRLRDLNEERQSITLSSVERISKLIESNKMDRDKVLVIYDEQTHESIAGIVAGRIKEQYNLPTIVLTKGKDMPKGSARSIEGYNIFEELVKCKDLLEKFGGHPMAAGLSLKEENIDRLRQRLNENCTLTEEELQPKVRIDQKLPLKYVSFKLVDEIQKLEPFGKGNPSPVFAEKKVVIERAYLLGKEKNVVKLIMRTGEGFNKIYGIFFDSVGGFKEAFVKAYDEISYDRFLAGVIGEVKADIIYYPDINEYNGSISLQLIIKDIRF
ncbi:single-stranded-DNA-specific exonuclease RecJ [Clostridium thermarum]|uniref:single-stranded-DNA-specific exonuclease RecJ n=1 Tax=Clostridium thermarum TaxID=1716543 RepID=UPI0013D33E2C|nr:single-stranded-DNA-specific exonuclease RecJ [Clostridium thermarum]